MDTSAYSSFLRSKSEIVEVLSKADWIGLPKIMLGELDVGFRLGSGRLKNIEELNEFLDNRQVEVLLTNRQIVEI